MVPACVAVIQRWLYNDHKNCISVSVGVAREKMWRANTQRTPTLRWNASVICTIEACKRISEPILYYWSARRCLIGNEEQTETSSKRKQRDNFLRQDAYIDASVGCGNVSHRFKILKCCSRT